MVVPYKMELLAENVFILNIQDLKEWNIWKTLYSHNCSYIAFIIMFLLK